MKKYSEYLAEQYKPMTAEQYDEWQKKTEDDWLSVGSEEVNKLVDEIAYLRSVLAECYMWMGRKVHSGSITKKYQWAMREAYRIRQEDKE